MEVSLLGERAEETSRVSLTVTKKFKLDVKKFTCSVVQCGEHGQ